PPLAPAPVPTPSPSPTPENPPVPTPPPPPPPPPVDHEYNNSGAAVSAKAQYAYDNGYTGKGVTIAILDSGIDIDNPEFAGRISSDSKSFEAKYATCGECPPERITFG